MDSSCEQSAASPATKDDAATKLRQGSILPRSLRDQLGLPDLKDNPDPVLIVISHDCDLFHKDEPYVELIAGQSKDELKSGFANGQSPRTLHLEFEHNGKKKVLELSGFNKVRVDKKMLVGVDPDPDATLTAKDLNNTLQAWLAARYKRAAFPDDLNTRMKPIKEKLSSADPKAIRGTWMRYEPEDNHLSRGGTIRALGEDCVLDVGVRC
ncbi:MAG: hypothetical protein WAK26_02485 [Terracidiphilus sp.]